MAVRIDFFTIAGTVDFELAGATALDAAVAAFEARTDPGEAAGPVRCVGWLSASDEDEDLFFDWGEVAGYKLGTGLLDEGLHEESGLSPDAVVVGDDVDERIKAWAFTLRDAVAAAAGGRFGWRTDYDLSGTTGTPDDYPTGASSAP